MTAIINTHIALIVLVLVVLFIGILQPRRKTAQRIFQLNADPEELWNIITDHARQIKWRTGLKKVEILAQNPDREAWTEYPVAGRPVTFRIRNQVPYSRIEMDIIRSGSFGTVRIVEIRKVGFYQTVVTLTEYADIANPFTRVLVHFLFNPDEPLARYAGDLTAEMQKKLNRLESQTS